MSDFSTLDWFCSGSQEINQLDCLGFSEVYQFCFSPVGVCVSRYWLEHCEQWAREQWRSWDAWFICAHCHRHNHQSGPAVAGPAHPHLLPGLWAECFHRHHDHGPAGVTGGPLWHAGSQLLLGVWVHPSEFWNSGAGPGPHPPVQAPQPPCTWRVCEWRWRCWCVSKFVCLSGLCVDSCSAGTQLTWELMNPNHVSSDLNTYRERHCQCTRQNN